MAQVVVVLLDPLLTVRLPALPDLLVLLGLLQVLLAVDALKAKSNAAVHAAVGHVVLITPVPQTDHPAPEPHAPPPQTVQEVFVLVVPALMALLG